MFEIIMLLAFLWAASSQFIPRKHTASRASLKKSGHTGKTRSLTLRQAPKRTGKKPLKAKSRNHNYAYAA